jgi:[ribosomal protein S5]-alanine N-acetyltransferase
MLETTRLRLVPLTHELLILYKNNPVQLAKALSINYIEKQNDPATATDLNEAIDFWLNSTLANPEKFQWFTTWEIILKQENISIGGIGFAGSPNEEGKTMVGYGLDIRYHNRGYATEALQALLQWGFSHNELKRILSETPLQNIGSQKVLLKNGFSETHRDGQLIHWQINK